MKEWCTMHKRLLLNVLHVWDTMNRVGVLVILILMWTGVKSAIQLEYMSGIFLVMVLISGSIRYSLRKKGLEPPLPAWTRHIEAIMKIVCIALFAGVFLILLGYLSQWIHGT